MACVSPAMPTATARLRTAANSGWMGTTSTTVAPANPVALRNTQFPSVSEVGVGSRPVSRAMRTATATRTTDARSTCGQTSHTAAPARGAAQRAKASGSVREASAPIPALPASANVTAVAGMSRPIPITAVGAGFAAPHGPTPRARARQAVAAFDAPRAAATATAMTSTAARRSSRAPPPTAARVVLLARLPREGSPAAPAGAAPSTASRARCASVMPVSGDHARSRRSQPPG